MSVFTSKYEKISFSLTAVLMVGLLVLLFFVGLEYMDPPTENGILISFGNAPTAEEVAVFKEIKQQDSAVSSEEQTVEEVEKEVLPVSDAKEEELLTQDESEVVVPREEPKKEVVELEKKEEKKPLEEKPSETKEKPKETPAPPKPDQRTTDALAAILGATASTTDQEAEIGKGNPGDTSGDPYAASYYGSANATGTVGYGLSGRDLLSHQVYKQDCNEEGTVVVQITVGKNGRVISADPGVKGTTNNANCLLEPAKKTALTYSFATDENAPAQQLGFVVIHFKLGQ